MRSEVGDSKIERHRQFKVAATVENPIVITAATDSKTGQHLEEGFSNTQLVRSKAEDSKIVTR